MSHFLKKRLASLENHLKQENPALLEVLPTYYKMGKMLYRTGLLDKESSLASRISWWPLISVLGTFSSGKSTFINDYIGESIQDTGNQAVDDKFTVVSYRSAGTKNQTLPGSALDADPRFPFFRMSREIEKVAKGEGKRIESYLQLRTANSDKVKNRILIDSPGFDADDQRTSTLRITDHILDLSDLVLVFFDARHPEPGAMQDTLEHLVARTIARTDASKFIYVLNQIDTAAKEDNSEAVVGAWQRAIAQAGLTAGKFYTIYNEAAAVPIEDDALRARFRNKRDVDLAEIHARMDEIEVQRNYRIVSVLETVANELEDDIIPQLRTAKAKWRRNVLIADGVALGLALAASIGIMTSFNLWPSTDIYSAEWVSANWLDITGVGVGLAILAFAFHFWVRGNIARRIARKLTPKYGQLELNLRSAFLKTSNWMHSLFTPEPAGWGTGAAKRLRLIRETLANHIQSLNDIYADPSGKTIIPEAEPETKTPTEE